MPITAVFLPLGTVRASGATSSYPTLYLSATSHMADISEVFAIDIRILDALNLQGFEFKLGYDASKLKVLEVAEGAFLTNFGTTLPLRLEANKTAGYVWVVTTVLGMESVEGEGTLATVSFEGIGTGECVFDLYDTLLVTSEAEYVDHYVTDSYSTNEFVDPISIEAALNWLATMQNPDGSWGQDYLVSRTAFAVLIFETQATHEEKDPLDLAYAFHDQVRKGLDYIFDNTYAVSINPQPYGDPDTDSDGIGIHFGSPETYNTGIAMMAIAGSNNPETLVNVASSYVNGWTYKEVLVDAVDYLAYGQTDTSYGRGGFGYEANEDWSDNSNTGYAVLGLAYAEAGFDCTIPSFVKSELNIWIYYIQNDYNGGSGYADPDDWVNVLKTGNLLSEMAFVGYTKDSQCVKDAVSYIESHWNDANLDPGWRGWPWDLAHKQAMYATMRGLESLGIETLVVDSNPVNWFADMYNVLLVQQNSDGSWGQDYWGDQILGTEWAILTLQRAVPGPPTPPSPYCKCDFDFDGDVDYDDLISLALVYGQTGPPGWIPQDLDKDGRVGLSDLVIFSICLAENDHTPPTTQLSLGGVLGTHGWYVSDVVVTLTATDWPSGILRTEYCFDGITWVEYTNPFGITTEGTRTIYYRSIDKKYNVEQTKSQEIKIDKTAPIVTIASPESGDYLDSELLTTDYSADDYVSGIGSLNATVGYDPALIYVDPQTTTAMLGDSFSIDINIADVSNLAGIELRLHWDNSFAEYLGHTVKAPIETYPEGILHQPVLFGANYASQSEGYAWFAFASMSSVSFSGSGTIATLTFRCISTGDSVFHLEVVDIIDADLLPIPYESIDGNLHGVTGPEEHDIAVTSVTFSPYKVTAGDHVTVTVVVENQGTRTEIFDVNIMYDSNLIVTEESVGLAWGTSKTLTFTWDTSDVGMGAYTISAEVSTVPGEIDTSDNELVSGICIVRIPVSSGQVFDLSTWNLGKYVLEVTAVDNAGNVAGESVTFSVVTTLSGVVTDEYTNDPISGVNISILETGESTITDECGRYSFTIRSAGTYTVEMALPYGYLTHEDVTKFIEVLKATQVSFTFYQASWSGATIPRTIGHWKNWNNHYSTEAMGIFIANVKSASGLFRDLTLNNIKSYLDVGGRSMEQKGLAQLLASWLNVVSAKLGVDVEVDLSHIAGWNQVINIPEGSVLTVNALLEQIDNLYLTHPSLTKGQWEIVKNTLDALNNGQLFIGG
jgi:hypothetical protein